MLISFDTLALLANEGDEEAKTILEIGQDSEPIHSRACALLGDFLIVSKEGTLFLEYL